MAPTFDRRHSGRLSFESFAEEVSPKGGAVYRQVRDVGVDGLFLVDRLGTTEPQLRLRFQTPDGVPVEVDAEVVRRTQMGVGVRFVNLPPEHRARLRRLCS